MSQTKGNEYLSIAPDVNNIFVIKLYIFCDRVGDGKELEINKV